MLHDLLISAGPLINLSLSAAIATIAGSFFLYSLIRQFNNQVARAFSLLLFFVVITYICDLGVSFVDESPVVAEAWLRFQWVGIAFVPACYVNLSHGILTMTGLPSRGRRRWLVRAFFVLSGLVLIVVLFSDWIVQGIQMEPAPHFNRGLLFPVFALYFIISVIIGFWFVVRARRRALTPIMRRQITYILITYLAPGLSVFPFLLISGRTLATPIIFYGVLAAVDFTLAVMLSILSYAMAFIGSLAPERLIKAQMLQFFLRGPVVAIAVLAVIVWVPRTVSVLGLPGDEVMPLLAVMVILFLQWAITIVRPHLERWLIYVGDQREIRRIQELEARLLTGADFKQLLDTILTAMCDYLRVETAFVASFANGGPKLERAIGLSDAFGEELEEAADEISGEARNGKGPHPEDVIAEGNVFTWRGFWLIPLHMQSGEEMEPRLVGLLGIDALAATIDELEEDQLQTLMALASRSAEVLEDRRVQEQVFASLEGLLPEMTNVERLREAARHGGLDALTAPSIDVVASDDFSERIKDALSHYWGGPSLTDSALMRLHIVRQALDEHEGNPQRAMRAVLQEAVENLRPEGQRSMTTTEWILYNILEMRFIQGRKVRDVAMRLAMSESDLYRKQRVAIEAVAEIIADMERAAVEEG